jgi:hypothetical protein
MGNGERQQVLVREIDHTLTVRLPDGTTGRIGYRLSELLEMFGGYQGVMTHPKSGEDVVISLDEWRNSDPETTYLEVGFLEWGARTDSRS